MLGLDDECDEQSINERILKSVVVRVDFFDDRSMFNDCMRTDIILICENQIYSLSFSLSFSLQARMHREEKKEKIPIGVSIELHRRKLFIGRHDDILFLSLSIGEK